MISIENARSTTGTKCREKDISPISGMCPLCIEECNVVCEVGKSAFRGREVLYPSNEYFGHSTAASNKNYMIDWSHFQILAELLGAQGIEANPDVAFFENSDITTRVATHSKKPIDLKVPLVIAGLGSTDVAKRNWKGMAMGAAMSGIIETIGENVCGMDKESIYTNGKVSKSPDMMSRIADFRELWDGKHGDIAVQTNVEDQRGGVDEYAISSLEVNIIERKWGQGAKAIGGEVRLTTLERALELKKRGYIVMPDPEDPMVQEAFKAGAVKTFERHSRVGFPAHESFVEDVEKLREKGAKYVFLKTGAYRPEVVAFTMKAASEAKIDMLTFDGAGGGTGMSPVPMMNEMSTPTVHLEAQVLMCAEIMRKKGKFVPDICFAGGFTNETQMFKSMAMSNLGDGPIVKAIAMARSPLTAVMKSQYFARLAETGKLPAQFASGYGDDPNKFFMLSSQIQKRYPDKKVGVDIPWGAVGLHTYFTDRIGEGLKQLMAGSRKFKLECLARDDIASLSEVAARITGIETFDQMAKRVIPGMLECW
ncbi:glutamate synthase [Candidatus Methanomassiliicoccus intestinalis]|uniref:Ferredoxin-dependent glutamate synthase n=3 Tax=Candidatus Methanomassiliicoccus intestinalis TaxID=1406512 RepID=R9T9R2_METII|nr:glutamate synthase [Candidatus Methanomassiliicoccus intestinalis]AGN26113.1 ferredoxin-dependent glutamate synthase [Candidatus Methanomassiliicoccus intestinalis Issoire-Mx1]TQS82234.1 MAG: glutamate synthase [Candidatus Methanomassiliicoccus intestinalis]TQS84800.1 MAG: glutamate synthase [Candidatus Methanomassiliicoccus intestinalis]